MIIKILGPGCTKCITLERITREVVDALSLDAAIEKVEDYAAILGYGVTSTPALVVDDRVVSSGRVPTPAHIRELLTTAASVNHRS